VALGLEQALKIVVSAVDNASGTLSNIRGAVQGLASDAATTAQTLDTIGSGLQQTGRSMTRYVTAPIVGGLVLSTKAAADFEERLTILRVALGDSAEDTEFLGEAAKQMGEDTQLPGVFGAMDALDAMTDITKAGFDMQAMAGDLTGYMAGTAELGGILQAGILLSAASDLTLAEATNTLITTLHTYGLEASDALDVANSYVQAADASAVSVRDLTGSIAAAGPSLDFYNMSLDDTLTALAIMGDRNIKGAEAGTNLRSMQNGMHRDTKRVRDALEELNVTLYDTEGAFRSPIEIIDDVNKAMESLTDRELATSVKDLFGNYGQLSGITLGKAGVEGWDEMNGKIAKAATVQEVAEARSGTFAAELGRLQDTIETFMINAGTPFIEDFLRPAVEWLQGFVEKLNDLNPATMDWLIRLSLIGAVVGPALIALGTLARSIASLITLYQLLAGAQSLVGGAGAAAGAGGAAAGAGGAAAALGVGGTALTALPALSAVPVVGAAVYATAKPAETERGLVAFQDWLRGLVGLDSLHPGVAAGTAEAPATIEPGYSVGEGYQLVEPPTPAAPVTDYGAAYAASMAEFEVVIANVQTAKDTAVEPPGEEELGKWTEWASGLTAVYTDEAGLSAVAYTTSFDAGMGEQSDALQATGVTAGGHVKAGMLAAAEDAGSQFVVSIARQIAPEIVPYVLAAIAARAATEAPVG